MQKVKDYKFQIDSFVWAVLNPEKLSEAWYHMANHLDTTIYNQEEFDKRLLQFQQGRVAATR